ncbi:MAG: sugar ABC transporter substrate-binding protein [Chloroflexi bacterium]|nr:sugar ABC transporter substrate-binding protein [Chloroflexota bacterium]
MNRRYLPAGFGFRPMRIPALMIVFALLIAAGCSGPAASSPTAAPAAQPAAKAQPTQAPAAQASPAGAASVKGKSIVMFVPTSTNNYVAQYEKGAKAEADKLGLSVQFIENNFKQQEQDVQVQQQVAKTDKPGAYVWWAADNSAGVASLKDLSDTKVPVFVRLNPVPGTESLWTAFVGPDDVGIGESGGKLMLQARDALKASGVTLHGQGGNAIIVTFQQGYSPGVDRTNGFKKAIAGSGIQVLDAQGAGTDEASGYKVGAQMIAANKAKGIDMLYGNNDAMASGAMKALDEAGLKPGKDVAVVGGNCHGDLSDLTSGREFGTILQPAMLEGSYAVDNIFKYLRDGTVKDGTGAPPMDKDKYPSLDGPVYKYNPIPSPPVLAKDVNSTTLWGSSMIEQCKY